MTYTMEHEGCGHRVDKYISTFEVGKCLQDMPLKYRIWKQQKCKDVIAWKLEQLERLHSKLPPTAPLLPIVRIHIRSHVIKRQSQLVTNSKNSQILEFCNNLYTRHTFSSWLIRCANMKWIRLLLWKIQSGHDFVHRRMDRRTTWNQYTPFNFVEAVGIIMREHCIGQTAWAAVIIMSWINMLRLEHYWGRVTHICLRKLTIIGSDNVLSPGRHQAIIRTNC